MKRTLFQGKKDVKDLTDFEKRDACGCFFLTSLLVGVSHSRQMLPDNVVPFTASWLKVLITFVQRKEILRRRHKSMIITLCHVEFIALATSSWVWGISIWSLLSVAEFPGSLFSWGPLCSQQTRMSLQDPYYGSYCNFLSGNLCKKGMSNMPSIVTTRTI